MKRLWVVAELNKGAQDTDGAQGVWEIRLTKDLPEQEAAGAALDAFHEQVGIENLDDFTVSVMNPSTKKMLLEPKDYQRAYRGHSEVERIANCAQDLRRAP